MDQVAQPEPTMRTWSEVLKVAPTVPAVVVHVVVVEPGVPSEHRFDAIR
jgi:hypothetical protein